MRALFIFITACLCAGCTSTVAVRRVDADAIQIRSNPGRYAAVVKSGVWKLHAASNGLVCGEFAFDADLNEPFETSMSDALRRSLELVEFLGEPLSPAQIEERGYRAQIEISQGEADAGFSASERLLYRDARSKVSLAAMLTVSDGNGVAAQISLSGRGARNREVFACSSIGEAVAESAHDALQAIVDQAAGRIGAATQRVGRRQP
jgi:hypothetical protein